jgi:uncharacterized OB-fold protein
MPSLEQAIKECLEKAEKKSKMGWECPKCGRVNAPWMPECPCAAGVMVPPKTSSLSDWKSG